MTINRRTLAGLVAALTVWGGVADADLALLSPRGRTLGPGQFSAEFENHQTGAGDIRYYLASYGLNETTEVQAITLDREGGRNQHLINFQYRIEAQSRYGPGRTIGVWDVQNQKEKGLRRSYYVATEQEMELPNRPGYQVMEYVGYGTGLLNGFFGGAVYTTPKGISLALEQSPWVKGFHLQIRYPLSDQFQLRLGSFNGDLAFGAQFTTDLGK